MKYHFGDMVIVDGDRTGVILKSYENPKGLITYDVYLKNTDTIHNYTENSIQRYINEKELDTLKLLTISAIAYAEWKSIIISKMHGDKALTNLYMQLPTVQGLTNDIALSNLKDSNINVNSINSLNDVLQAM